VAEVVVVGGGGHAKVLIAVLKKLGWRVVGFTDVRRRDPILGAAYLGDDDVLPDVLAAHPSCAALLGVGKVDDSVVRDRLGVDLRALGFAAPVVVSPCASVNEEVELGGGTAVFDGAVVNSGTVAGRICIVNTNSTVEHDCRLGDNVHVAPGATLSGAVRIGSHSMIGAGATIIQDVTVCSGCVVGAGAVVVADIESPGVYAGNPARRIR